MTEYRQQSSELHLEEEEGVKFLSPHEYRTKLREWGSEKLLETYERVLAIAEAVRQAGGRALLVGGSVRDSLMGRASKDFDIEVYGLKPNQLEVLAQQFGKVSEVGKAFGILKLSSGEGIDIDLSLPRTDSKIGEGHRGFAVKVDPHMSIEDAAQRRDFTINSVAADPLTGELFDPFGGVKDLKERRLRVTDAERFRDDPLRVMRALQFIGRFGLELDSESSRIIQEMAPELRKLPKERIGEEWKKLLLKSKKPSLGLAAGMALGVFHEIHPELPPLAGTPQEQEWHPEGDVWVHTLMVVDEAAKIVRREQIAEEQALTVLLASLAHDFGKPAVTEFRDERWRAHEHESAGVEPTQKFLTRLGTDALTRDKVVKLVANHLAPGLFYVSEVVKGKSVSDGAIRRLAERIAPATIQELVLVAEADHSGRGPFVDPEIPEQLLLPEGFPAGRWLLERARKINVEKSKPTHLITGKALVQLGFRPGISMGRVIALADQLRDEKEFSADMIFVAVHGLETTEQAVSKLESLLNEK
ncbi:HD domain-containing protein [Candidatus Uhrbacteria bacterium]|nr:HD domain-containing protein [Candidatus Uhrbacteria bacterium]